MKDRLNVAVKTTKKRVTNLEEILNALALSVVVGFSGYMAVVNIKKGSGYEWYLLAAAAVWAMFQAMKSWSRVLDK